MTNIPICKNCVHRNRGSKEVRPFPDFCARWPDKPSVVHGTVHGETEYCYDERQRTFWDRLFKRDKCGPEGKYFKPRLHLVQSLQGSPQ